MPLVPVIKKCTNLSGLLYSDPIRVGPINDLFERSMPTETSSGTKYKGFAVARQFSNRSMEKTDDRFPHR
jgi:hypothetical protein